MKDYFSKNWLSILGLVIGIIGIYIAFYFYEQSKSSRIPLFIVDPQRTEILNDKNLSNEPIKVRTAKGDEITKSLTSIRFYFWNQGNLSIRQENILEPIKIFFKDHDSKIIDFKILKSSRPISKIMLEKDTSNLNTLILKFNILEKSDGLTGQILYEGNPLSELSISGLVEGARPIDESKEILSNITIPEYLIALKDLWTIILSFIVLILIAAIAIQIEKSQKWFSTNKYAIYVYKIFSKVWAVIVILFAIVSLYMFVNKSIIEPIKKAKSSGSVQMQKVPQSIKEGQ